ncbi:alpha/beta fold hydrolase [Egicoccus sp. AB-alg6-2]|uniref:alpha/beta fold hydrolase n=1 Tax=Egicoccus sp. AB-alg6-2 TaxID=3242692 RepID=UPI00359CD1A2
MPTVTIDGIQTEYRLVGEGPPLLMFSPGGFNAVADNWSDLGVYRRIRLLDELPRRHTCILFDRRESGRSGGRVERLTWAHYVEQGRGLLDHLDIERAHLMGGCVGCSVVASFAVAYPARVASMVLYSPAGGARYRMTSRARFERHLAFVEEEGLGGVVELARSSEDGFSKDPRLGPWVSVIRNDPGFAERYADYDPEAYRILVTGLSRAMFDRDSVPGPEPEDLMLLDVPALVVPGNDGSHATSAAHYLHECLPRAEYWDVPVEEQTATSAPSRIAGFLEAHA